VFPTYNEKESIRACCDDFFLEGVVDELIVVNNNAAPGTSEEVAKTRAREVHEPIQGYGAAIRRGFREATGDLIIVSEPDGTFAGRDIRKLLAYSEDFEVVYGSRTVKELIWQGANMGLFLKWGNYWVAKLMEVLFNTTSLTDVGCTMRCIRREALREVEPFFTVNGSFFGPEMMVLTILKRMKIIQIPMNYTERVGHSSVTGNKIVAFFLGLRMIRLVLSYRVRSWLFPKAFER
jgi:glycosyltransferase involved in cell wall biosynthesis